MLHINFLKRAIELAHQAKTAGEVPVGAVVVLHNEIIGEGFNQPISSHDPTAHAEIVALRQAAKAINNYRLSGAVLYVTLESCAMCAAAMMHARISKVVFGAYDPKSAAHTIFASELAKKLNHQVQSEGGVMVAECTALLKVFFKDKR